MADPKLNLATKAEVDRDRSARSVLGALRTHGNDLVAVLAPRFDPDLFPGSGAETEARLAARAAVEDSTPRRMVDRTISLLSRIHDEMLETGRHHRTMKVERLAAKRRLRRIRDKVRTALFGVRDQFFSTYGEEFSVDLGFSRITPRAPGELLENVLHLEKRLGTPPEDFPEPAPGRMAIDLGEQLRLLAPLFDELKAAVETYETVLRNSQTAFINKIDAIKAFDKDFTWLAGTAESMFQLARMPLQAELVRPSRRRTGVTQVVSGETVPTGDETDGEDPTGDEPAGDEPNSPDPAASDEVQETPSDGEPAVTD